MIAGLSCMFETGPKTWRKKKLVFFCQLEFTCLEQKKKLKLFIFAKPNCEKPINYLKKKTKNIVSYHMIWRPHEPNGWLGGTMTHKLFTIGGPQQMSDQWEGVRI